jgi:hypothetical protein
LQALASVSQRGHLSVRHHRLDRSSWGLSGFGGNPSRARSSAMRRRNASNRSRACRCSSVSGPNLLHPRHGLTDCFPACLAVG